MWDRLPAPLRPNNLWSEGEKFSSCVTENDRKRLVWTVFPHRRKLNWAGKLQGQEDKKKKKAKSWHSGQVPNKDWEEDKDSLAIIWGPFDISCTTVSWPGFCPTRPQLQEHTRMTFLTKFWLLVLVPHSCCERPHGKTGNQLSSCFIYHSGLQVSVA